MKNFIKLSKFIIVCALTFQLAGCLTVIKKVDKVLTFRNYELYESNVEYSMFDSNDNVRISFTQGKLDVRVADNNQWLQFGRETGSTFFPLKKISITEFNKDIEPFKAFIRWANKTYQEREETKLSINELPYGYIVVNETNTLEPLLIFGGKADLFYPPKLMALNKENVLRILVTSYSIKNNINTGSD
ncbi:hypothetical protein [Pragia fontium]|uniref:Uncharacterized protein n=1 Tax=Pragia fontium DSM 5563 = ATCC 49100 TaxID=1122977 RepID=A0AAJ5BH30_9GAMM|nr:hypothetical protein [Pragia fontium]SFC76988.1 hypothetical protein SAMN02745723_10477 [Pragia fontium DSM 5563 = ATCC 49100]